MGKVVRFTSAFAPHMCYRNNNTMDDQINRLPNDILVRIISRLAMGEAARTSILSRRWRYLWTFFDGSLDFDGSKTLYDTEWNGKSLTFERTRFISWVNQVLASHQAPSVDELNVRFDLDSSSESDSNSWIKFAIRKKIKKLKLDFSTNVAHHRRDLCTFPLHLLQKSTLGFLTTLCLARVLVTGEVLEHLVAHIPCLEAISVELSEALVSFKVSGPSLNLKKLEILDCYNLKNLEISAENLVSFKYAGEDIKMPFKHVPRLAEVSFKGDFSMYVIENLGLFSSYFMQLERLSLCVRRIMNVFSDDIPQLANLKYLELTLLVYNQLSLVKCTRLLDAAPMLHEFTLQVGTEERNSPFYEPAVKHYKYLFCSKRKYRRLKVVELVGCSISSTVAEFIAWVVLERVVSLDTVIVNPRRKELMPYKVIPSLQSIGEQAMKLAAQLPPGVELVILQS